MEQQLKQRLVGVAVIFSLAVIFLPMLLDGSGNRSQHLKISIPPQPDIASYEPVEEKVIELKKKIERIPRIDPVVVDEVSDPPDVAKKVTENSKPVELEQNKSSTRTKELTTIVKVEPKPLPLAEPRPSVNVKKEPVKKISGGESWVIQVGSFNEKNKAYKQRDKLRKSRLAAVFIEKFKHDGVLSYRVRMGPFISRDKAKVVGNKVRAKYNIKGLVMRYKN